MPDSANPSGGADAAPQPRLRADAQRSRDALLEAAKIVFARAGVDAPVRDIAEQAGVGLGTVYRRFPHRADLIAAVFRREMDACAEAAAPLAAAHPPFAALALWLQRYAAFVGTKRGLSQALHSGDPAYAALPAHFEARLRPAYRGLFERAVESGSIRRDVDATELLNAVSGLCLSGYTTTPEQAERMIALLMDGLRYGAGL